MTSQKNLVHFSLKIWHLVATVLIIFLRINWPNLVQYCSLNILRRWSLVLWVYTDSTVLFCRAVSYLHRRKSTLCWNGSGTVECPRRTVLPPPQLPYFCPPRSSVTFCVAEYAFGRPWNETATNHSTKLFFVAHVGDQNSVVCHL